MFMLCESPSITDWITALSTLALGVAGTGFAIYQWVMAGFRPKVAAYLETSEERIVVTVENRGRGSGAVYGVDIVNGSEKDAPLVPSSIVARPSMDSFPQTVLNSGNAILVVLRAEHYTGAGKTASDPAKFPRNAHVLIQMSVRRRHILIKPVKKSNLSFANTLTQLPPR